MSLGNFTDKLLEPAHNLFVLFNFPEHNKIIQWL